MDLDRRHVRLPAEYHVYIEAEAGTEGESIELCRALDVSLHGIRLQLNRELPVGAFIHLGVEAAGAAPLILVAIVRWSRPVGEGESEADGHWLAGLELQVSSHSDYEDWCDLLQSLAE